MLWKVDGIPISSENLETKIRADINIEQELGGMKLPPSDTLKQHFSRLFNQDIQIIIKPPIIRKRKTETESSDEENEDSGRKKKKLIDLSPKSIAEFLEKQEGIKNDFEQPSDLCVNEFRFERKGRDDTILQTYDYIFDRYCKIRKPLRENRSIQDQKLYPLLALQSTPGGGKSFFLDELASLKSEDLDRYLKIKFSDLEKKQGSDEMQQHAKDFVNLLRNSVGICITYNGSSQYGDDIDGDIRRGLVMRILWSYFFDGNKLGWYAFCKKFRNHFDSLDTSTAVQSIIHHSRKSVLLCVDETMRVLSGNNTNRESIKILLHELYEPYHALSASESKFHFVVSTLDAINMWQTQTKSDRPINWIPLRRLALSESVELFHEVTKSLSDRRLFIIKKCIADCNGHPRTLEKFYQLLHDDIALNTDVYSSLIERLATNLVSLFCKISFSIVKMALLGQITSLMDEIETTLGTSTLRDLISSGIYINSLTDNSEILYVTPTLSPVSLQYFCMFSKNKVNDVNDDAKTVAKILRDLLTTEYSFDDEVMDGKPFERFHANWELLYRALRDDEKEVSLCKIYGFLNIDQPKIKLRRKISIARLDSLEFPPPDEICDTEGKSIKNFVNYVLVPTKTNNGDFDMVIFEQKVGDTGYIAINIECKFSYPGRITKLSNNEIKEKYEHTKNKYYTHVRYERQKIRNSPMSWEEGKFMTDLP
ncbi:hypothetical protein C2G38_2036671 [Gigaspora rosea]|uniref:Crinkler family protein n=1 Tax=Gigaspora rosea TaxID=44941 RepID=A0A397V841_9GLOM|nr:hypothetical protein C2G38_2036671 [Gigaspora rosea]